jgi:hypothetical protein
MRLATRCILVCSLFAPDAVNAEPFVRGEVTADAEVNISDAIFILMHLFLGGPAPPCLDAADVNDDGAVGINDAVYELAYLFGGGKVPPRPGPVWPGHDGTPVDPFVCGDEPGETPLDEDEIFTRLTANGWILIEPDLFGSVTSHMFQKSGGYFFCRYSDIPEGAETSQWNFEKLTDSGGVITIDGKSIFHFSLRSDGSLRIGNMTFQPGEYRQGFSAECKSLPADCEDCARSQLHAVSPPSLAAALVNTRWLKANDFSLYSEPTELEFLGPGRYRASFRGDECSFTSFWSLSQDYFLFEQLGCDFRIGDGSGPVYIGSEAILEGQSLRFDDQEVYLSAGSDLTQGIIVVMVGHLHAGNGYNASLVGTYERPFRRGSNPFRFRLSPLRRIEPPYGELTLRRQTLLRTEDGFTFVGEPTILGRAALPAVLPEAGFELELDWSTPDGPGDFLYELRLDGEFWLFPGHHIATVP